MQHARLPKRTGGKHELIDTCEEVTLKTNPDIKLSSSSDSKALARRRLLVLRLGIGQFVPTDSVVVAQSFFGKNDLKQLSALRLAPFPRINPNHGHLPFVHMWERTQTVRTIPREKGKQNPGVVSSTTDAQVCVRLFGQSCCRC